MSLNDNDQSKNRRPTSALKGHVEGHYDAETQYQPLGEASEAPALGLAPKGDLALMQVKMETAIEKNCCHKMLY